MSDKAKVTLAFMYYRDFANELQGRGIEECRVQPMISVENTDSEPLPYVHLWLVVLTAWVPSTAEILAARLFVADYASPFSDLNMVPGPFNADLAMASDLIHDDLARLGITARPGFYPHDEFGYGMAPDLWYFQEGRLAVGPQPQEESENERSGDLAPSRK
jgi:hypothetical protein